MSFFLLKSKIYFERSGLLCPRSSQTLDKRGNRVTEAPYGCWDFVLLVWEAEMPRNCPCKNVIQTN